MRLGFVSCIGALAASTLWPATAQAQGGTDSLKDYVVVRGDRARVESPQTMAFEVRLGPYLPNVDDEFNGATPFADTFGDDTRWLVGLELDWQLLRIPHFGTLGPGVGWGYTKANADAPLAGQDGRSEQSTSLTVMPFYAVGVLRVDTFARDYGIPLVPYGKAGLGYALWWSGSGEITARDDNDRVGRGASYGFQYSLGGMLLLDWLDEESAVQMDTTSGVNNSYIFLEWYVSDLSGFGSGDRMQVGDNTWMTGLAFEF